ncbi:formylglycine-generating enzyme family protein, partial [Candidatus Uhrbacteria bacterium]|nr:formylglycine-generating enzyme family protein [Candidatus Uhrbacteria bacterium]
QDEDPHDAVRRGIMENKNVLWGAIIFVFGSFILMIVGLVYESYKSKQMRLLTDSIVIEPEPRAVATTEDFSMYRTFVGDDGRAMVQVPEGPFTMGSREGDPDEAPEHQVYLSTYYIDLKEVTQGDYARFVRMTKRGKPFIPVFEDDQSKILKPELPAIGMSWSDAVAYCKWAGKRLPTEAEWEKAARGEGRRRYPWGNEFGIGRANTDGSEDGFRYLSGPGSFESGRSPYGVFDMTGNDAEWVDDTYDEQYYQKTPYRDPKGPEDGQHKVIRGGSWRETPQNARVAKRFQAKMWRTDSTIGIRCAKDTDEPAAAQKKTSGRSSKSR